MKKQTLFTTYFLLCLSIATTMLSPQQATAQNNQPYFAADELPNAVYWMPAPPASGSSQFMHDISQYYWGKEQRLDTARAHKAIREAQYEVADMVRQFSAAFGMEISEQTTPAIYHVLERGIHTIRLSAVKPKAKYMRTRPYVYFNEPTLVPDDEAVLRTNGSYPSGHTVRGWGMALLLCEINPDAQDALLKLGYEWGQSRVIAGYHWQSDVDAARMLAAACYARLHTSQAFLDDMAAAKKEFTRIRHTQGAETKK
ncbi:MAG: acid phosphatase, class A [bacterium P3]|nr:MAG: acid phosphatase, class A [bacterium P3]KWW39045.1 MAG: acid phosphatase, class A [bacterium F083]